MIFRLALLLLLALGWTTPVFADATAGSVSISPASPNAVTTLSHTVSGSNTILIAGVVRDGASISSTTMTYASTAMTELTACRVTPPDGFGQLYVYFLINPPSGTNNVVSTLSASTNNFVFAMTVIGASQTMVAGNFVCPKAIGTSTTPSIAITRTAGQLALAMLSTSNGTTAPTITPAQTAKWNVGLDGQISTAGFTVAGGTSGDLNFTLNQSLPWATAALVVDPASGASDTVAPTAPSDLACAAIGSSTITCTWSAATDNVGVLNYILQRAPASCGGTFAQIAAPATRSYTDTGLTPNTIYCYRVFATDGPNTSVASPTASATTLPLRQATVHWTNPVTYDSVTVQRCEGANCTSPSTIGSAASGATSYIDTSSPQPVAGYSLIGVKSGFLDSANTAIVYTSSLPPPILTVSPPQLTFAATISGSNPNAQALTINNAVGSQAMAWTLSDDATWFTCTPSSGVDSLVLSCSVNITGLSSGTQFATITVSAPGATNDPTTVLVTLNLSPASAPKSGQSGRIR